MTALTRPDGSEHYVYDDRDRLSEVCYDAPCASSTDTIAWAYDPVGNRLTETRPAGTTSYSYDSADELTQTSGPDGSTSYGYDARGNQTAAGADSYTYNLANQLTAATVDGATASYSYDGDGNRLTATTGGTTTSYLWDTNDALPQLALERDGAGTSLRDYIRGIDTLALVEGGVTYYYHHDHLGSVTALTSASGQTEWSYIYEPFGSPKTTTKVDPAAPENPLGYVGQYQDPSSSLYDLRARQYNPAIGLFTSTDPKPAGPTSPYEATYDYAGQDPINELDLGGERAANAGEPGEDGEAEPYLSEAWKLRGSARITRRALDHSFDRHAKDWFKSPVSRGGGDLDVWAAEIEDAIHFGRPLERTLSTGRRRVFGFLREDGSERGLVAYFDSGTGELLQAHPVKGRSYANLQNAADTWWKTNMSPGR